MIEGRVYLSFQLDQRGCLLIFKGPIQKSNTVLEIAGIAR